MAGERVEISYQVYVKNIEELARLRQENQALGTQIQDNTSKLASTTKAHENHMNTLLKARAAIRLFHKEMYVFTFVAAIVAGTFKILAMHSDELTARLEKSTTGFKDLGEMAARKLNDIIDWLIRASYAVINFSTASSTGQVTNFWTGLPQPSPTHPGASPLGDSVAFQLKEGQLKLDILTLSGDKLKALEIKQTMEMLKFRKDASNEEYQRLKGFYELKQKLEMEDFKMSELGLKKNIEIITDFKRGIVDSFRTGIGDPIFKFLQGEKQTPMDVMKGFMTGINRTIANAIADTIVTKLFKPADLTKQAVEDGFKTANGYLSCIASATCGGGGGGGRGGGGGGSLSIDLPGAVKIGNLANIIGGISALGSVGSLLSGIAGFAGIGAGAALPNIVMGAGAFRKGLRGGWSDRLPHYGTGGEIPAILHSGEFVVNAGAAQANKGILKEINESGKMVRGTTNVFLIKANDPASFAQMLTSKPAQDQLEVQMMKKIMSNSEIRRIIKDFAR